MSASSRCARRRRAAGVESDTWWSTAPRDAATAVMLSIAPTEPPQLVFLFCDDGRRVRLGVSVDGAGPTEAPHAAECLLSAADDGWSTGLVVGLVLPGESTELRVAELAPLLELSTICDDVGLPLLELVVIAGSHWRSALALVVGSPDRGNTGNQ